MATSPSALIQSLPPSSPIRSTAPVAMRVSPSIEMRNIANFSDDEPLLRHRITDPSCKLMAQASRFAPLPVAHFGHVVQMLLDIGAVSIDPGSALVDERLRVPWLSPP